MESSLMDERIYYPHDPVFAELFPNHSRVKKRQPPFLSSTPENTLNSIYLWASDLVKKQRHYRHLTVGLVSDLKILAQGIVTIANRPLDDEQEELERANMVICDATMLFHQVGREDSMHFMIKQLVDMNLTNLLVRYMPRSPPNTRIGHEIPSPFAVHAAYICEKVQLEATAFGRWKDEIEHGDASAMRHEQPPRLWNNILADVSRHARDVHYFDSPEPFSFESILRVLQDAHHLRLDAEKPGSFRHVDELDQLNELNAADTLAEDLWAVEVRYRAFEDSCHFKDVTKSIHQALQERYCRVQMTASGKLCSVWKNEGDGTQDGEQIVFIDDRESFERHGVPWVEVVGGKVVARKEEPEDSTDARWDLDIGRVRRTIVLIWDEIPAPPPPYKDQLPLYEEVVDQPSVLEGGLTSSEGGDQRRRRSTT